MQTSGNWSMGKANEEHIGLFLSDLALLRVGLFCPPPLFFLQRSRLIPFTCCARDLCT